MVPSSSQKSKGPHRRDHRHPTASVPRHSRSFVAAAKPPPNSRGDADAIVAAASSSPQLHRHVVMTTAIPRHRCHGIHAASSPPQNHRQIPAATPTPSPQQLHRRSFLAAKSLINQKKRGCLPRVQTGSIGALTTGWCGRSGGAKLKHQLWSVRRQVAGHVL